MRQIVFDKEHYTQINEARLNFLKQWLPGLVTAQGLKNSLDVGCGVGFFSRYLASLGLEVLALDARSENISEAQKRHPDIKFLVEDIENPIIKKLGSFDLTFCFGILYHLENPFLGVRNLHALTKKILLIESKVTPSSFASGRLVDETFGEDQSKNYIAFIPSELGLIKMLYSSGFPYVYVFNRMPNHENFCESTELYRKRIVMAATKIPLDTSFLRLVDEPATVDPWIKSHRYQLNRVRSFLRKPWRGKIAVIRFRFKSLWFRLLPSTPLPIRSPYGGWWLDINDRCSNLISQDNFEKAEWRFVEHFLKEGMTAMDIGAHHGFYTILYSRKVGPSGCVIAFEPSPREAQRLLLHLRLNRCRNVKVERIALSGRDGEAPFFVIEGNETVFNSLRPPKVLKPTKEITVITMRLDNYLKREDIRQINFVKIDAEGAELEILKGADGLFNRNSSPVIMAEVSEMRTEQWGYRASEIFDFLSERGYRWFTVNSEGKLKAFQGKEQVYNFVAVPENKLAKMEDLIEI